MSRHAIKYEFDDGDNMDVDSPDRSLAGSPVNEPVPADSLFIKTVTETLASLNARLLQLQISVERQGGSRVPAPTGDDVFEGTSTQKQKRGKQTKEENDLRQAVREHVQDMFKFKAREPINTWAVAERSRSDGYSANLLPQDGPTDAYMPIDWHSKGMTLWFTDCITISTQVFLNKHGDGDFPLLRQPVTQPRVYAASRDYILYLKRRYRGEMDDPVMALEMKQEADQRSRSSNRRVQLLGRRLALMRHHAFPEEAIGVVEQLDVDGISSEESEGEVGVNRTYRIKRLPWRSHELGTWLQRIDAMPTKNMQNGVLSRRCNHRQRTSSDKESQRRGPVGHLPTNLYNADWIRDQGDRAVLRLGVINEPILLPKIDDLTPRH